MRPDRGHRDTRDDRTVRLISTEHVTMLNCTTIQLMYGSTDSEDMEDEMTSTYRAPKEYAAEIRNSIKAAQKSGELDPKWKISVRTELASMCAEIAVSITNARDHIELFVEDEDTLPGGRWSDEAFDLAKQVRKYMAPAEDWHDGRMHFLFLYFGGGLLAP
jgi:hypothetical protein